jgi:hypothetical protein
VNLVGVPDSTFVVARQPVAAAAEVGAVAVAVVGAPTARAASARVAAMAGATRRRDDAVMT